MDGLLVKKNLDISPIWNGNQRLLTLLRVSLLNCVIDVDYRKTTTGDIISMLLNIYDTKEVFVKELQVILAERLLLSKDYNVEREVVPLKYR
jgi:hypothetical protein